MKKIILDTDIGSDVDDAVALALAMRSPQLTIEGVTTVYGDVQLRAQLAAKLLELGKQAHIKVYAGISQPLLRKREVWWAGHEGEGVLEDRTHYDIENMHAVDFIIETIMDNPGKVTLVPIGPLTNIAAAIIKEPAIIEKVKGIVMMGGVSRLGDSALALPHIEHNIKCDPEAAAVVLESGAPITMVGLDVTMKVSINNQDKNRLTDSGDPLNIALAKLIDKWFSYIRSDQSAMHDPLAIASLLDDTLLKTVQAKVNVEYDQCASTGQTVVLPDSAGKVKVGLDVNSSKFHTLLLNTLLKAD